MRQSRRHTFVCLGAWAVGATIATFLAGCVNDGKGSLVKLTTLPAGDARCAAGGVLVSAGSDRNGNGTLDADEVVQSEAVCAGAAGAPGAQGAQGAAGAQGVPGTAGADGTNGSNGTPGMDGAPGTNGVNGAAGANGKNAVANTIEVGPTEKCPAGGLLLEAGVDDDENGTLDEAEVDVSSLVCNGAQGAPGQAAAPPSRVTTTTLAVGDTDCQAGGIRVDLGVDTNGSGVLDSSEITETRFVCNGGFARLADSLFPYEGFAGGYGSLNRARWQDLDLEREVVGGMLRFSSRSESGTAFNLLDADSSATASNDFGAALRLVQSRRNDPGEERFMGAKVEGAFYNDVSASPADRTGDVFASLDVEDRNTFLVVYRCTTANCSSVVGVTGQPLAGRPDPFSEHEYRVVYDGDRTFTAIVDGATLGSVQGNPRMGPARQPIRRIGTGVNAVSGGQVAAEFSEVLVGNTSYDDFATNPGRIDLTKWVSGELVRSPRGGRLAIRQAHRDTASSSALRLENAESHRAISAEVAVQEFESTGANVRMRLLQFLYNDGTTGAAPGSRVGDIGAEVSMNNTEAFVMVFRCTNADCTTGTLLTNPSGNGRVSLGATALGSRHMLYLAWDGAKVTAQLDARAPLVFDPVAAGAPIANPVASTPFVTVGSRVTAASGQRGYVRGTIDQVRTGS
jgi:hypothetical protein